MHCRLSFCVFLIVVVSVSPSAAETELLAPLATFDQGSYDGDIAPVASPDGRFVYQTYGYGTVFDLGPYQSGLAVHRLHAVTGELETIQRVELPADDRFFGGSYSLALSSNGERLLWGGDGRVASFRRDGVTGVVDIEEVEVAELPFPLNSKVRSLAVSPSERYVYAVAGGGVAVLEHEAGTGDLTLVEKILGGPDGGWLQAFDIALSPEGDDLLILTIHGLFDARLDPTDGRVTNLEQLADYGSEDRIVLSPDGRHAYVGGYSPGIDRWERTLAGDWAFLGEQQVVVPWVPAVDGTHLVAVDSLAGDLVVLERSIGDGALTEVDRFSSGREMGSFLPTPHGEFLVLFHDPLVAELRPSPSGGWSLGQATVLPLLARYLGAKDVVVDPEHRFFHVALAGGIATHERSEDGNFVHVSILWRESGDRTAMAEPIGLKVTPDGRHLIALGGRPDDIGGALTVWRRDPATGALARVANVPSEESPHLDVLRSPSGLALSLDGRFVYTASSASPGPCAGTIGVWSLDAATGALSLVQAFERLRHGHAALLAPGPDGLLAHASIGGCDPSGEGGAVELYRHEPLSSRLTLVASLVGDEVSFGRSLAFAGDGEHLVHVGRYHQIRLLRRAGTSDGLEIVDIAPGSGEIAVDPESSRLLLAGPRYDGTVGRFELVLHDASGGRLSQEPLQTISLPLGDYEHSEEVGVTWSPDGNRVYLVREKASSLTLLDRRCLPEDGDATCLRDGRFRVRMRWSEGDGLRTAKPVVDDPATSQLFWFSSAANWEALVKVLDGCSWNDRYWVFAATATHLEHQITVDDTWTASRRTFGHGLGDASVALTATDAFAACDVPPPPWFDGGGGTDPVATAGESLGLQDGRFRVTVLWDDGSGPRAGKAAALRTDDAGLFSFASADNWELLVKVLDGCSWNDRFWVFTAGTTNLGYRIEVEDLVGGGVRVYENPLGAPAPTVTDTAAFTGCSP